LAEAEPLILVDNAIAQVLFGENDRNLRELEELLPVEIQARGNHVNIRGPRLESLVARRALEDLYDMAASGIPISPSEVHQVVQMSDEAEQSSAPVEALQQGDTVAVGRRKRIVPRTANQTLYVQAIRRADMVFGMGPAGTGKTYIAMAMAVSALLRREVGRIIVTRPAVEAGEKLGYLPGTLAWNAA
jgi:phosphate starvation-inducible PhoH-like protein